MMDMCEMETETQLQSPPTSLVPRLHVIYADKIAVNNPLLPPQIKFDGAQEEKSVDENKNADAKQSQAEGMSNSSSHRYITALDHLLSSE